MKRVQQLLNINGATDKFGNKLKEDGISGPKTQWAIDGGAMLGGVTAYGATTNMETNKVIGKASSASKNVSRTSEKKESLTYKRLRGGFDGESCTMRYEYWGSKDMPYVSKILN